MESQLKDYVFSPTLQVKVHLSCIRQRSVPLRLQDKFLPSVGCHRVVGYENWEGGTFRVIVPGILVEVP